MPKLKTKKTLLRRIKISKHGAVRRSKVGLKHLKVNKNSGQKLRFKAGGTMSNKKILGRFKAMLGKHGKNL